MRAGAASVPTKPKPDTDWAALRKSCARHPVREDRAVEGPEAPGLEVDVDRLATRESQSARGLGPEVLLEPSIGGQSRNRDRSGIGGLGAGRFAEAPVEALLALQVRRGRLGGRSQGRNSGAQHHNRYCHRDSPHAPNPLLSSGTGRP